MTIFEASELETLQRNIVMMQHDVRLQYRDALDASHHGAPLLTETVRTGRPGRPSIHIDPQFLQWAYAHRSTAGISRFLNVARSTVRDALLHYGIAQPQQNPFAELSYHGDDTIVPYDFSENDDLLLSASAEHGDDHDDLLDPEISLDQIMGPANSENVTQNNGLIPENPAVLSSYTGPLSTITDDELDSVIHNLRAQYRRAGIGILDGMLRRLGHRIQRERIRASLMRIDPVQRVFQRIHIRR